MADNDTRNHQRIAELEGENTDLKAALNTSRACTRERDQRCQVLEAGLTAVSTLMNESDGVAGLHRNGDVAPWSELRTGGRFESWLLDFDATLAEPNAAGQSEGTQGQGEEVARAAPATVPGRPAAPAASFIVAAGALADEYDCPIHGKLGSTSCPRC